MVTSENFLDDKSGQSSSLMIPFQAVDKFRFFVTLPAAHDIDI
jgi:hypothetical protein